MGVIKGPHLFIERGFMKFKVKANKLGYYDHRRYREDEVFMMDENFMAKKSSVKDESKLAKCTFVSGSDGDRILPTWVDLVDDVPKYSKPVSKPKEKELNGNKDVI